MSIDEISRIAKCDSCELAEAVDLLREENRNLRQFIRSQGLEVPLGLATPNQEAQEFLETGRLEDLDITSRTYNAIYYGIISDRFGDDSLRGIHTIKDLVSHQFSELFRLRNFGEKSAIDLMRALKKRGISMAEETDSKHRKLVESIYRRA